MRVTIVIDDHLMQDACSNRARTLRCSFLLDLWNRMRNDSPKDLRPSREGIESIIVRGLCELTHGNTTLWSNGIGLCDGSYGQRRLAPLIRASQSQQDLQQRIVYWSPTMEASVTPEIQITIAEK